METTLEMIGREGHRQRAMSRCLQLNGWRIIGRG